MFFKEPADALEAITFSFSCGNASVVDLSLIQHIRPGFVLLYGLRLLCRMLALTWCQTGRYQVHNSSGPDKDTFYTYKCLSMEVICFERQIIRDDGFAKVKHVVRHALKIHSDFKIRKVSFMLI